ncbi:MAG: phytanoyl-CoA dioxygenase family protein, partial [Lentisphaeria bacterium]|nr:phytanoyl-CoA dioxygenase family protein [Lentisphaeria bacterium]NQZ67159.1 phytanoyl-CoA dioxygenase family protein [Lentisphaeria bacterium]
DETEWPLDRAVCVEGKAGDSIFFNVNCIHGSPENHSDVGRPVFINRWRRADDHTVAGGTLAENRTEYDPENVKPKSRGEYMTMVAGRREFKES